MTCRGVLSDLYSSDDPAHQPVQCPQHGVPHPGSGGVFSALPTHCRVLLACNLFSFRNIFSLSLLLFVSLAYFSVTFVFQCRFTRHSLISIPFFSMNVSKPIEYTLRRLFFKSSHNDWFQTLIMSKNLFLIHFSSVLSPSEISLIQYFFLYLRKLKRVFQSFYFLIPYVWILEWCVDHGGCQVKEIRLHLSLALPVQNYRIRFDQSDLGRERGPWQSPGIENTAPSLPRSLCKQLQTQI